MQIPAKQSKAWRKTNVANLYVHRNGGYYFRVTVGRKQIWESLHTKLKSVAEARAAEKHRAVRSAEKNHYRGEDRKVDHRAGDRACLAGG